MDLEIGHIDFLTGFKDLDLLQTKRDRLVSNV